MLFQSASDLNALFRAEVDDIIGSDPPDPIDVDRLWKEAEVYGYATEAVDALARITQALYRTLQLPVVVNQQLYSLPAYVLNIRQARLLTAARMLTQRNADQFGGMRISDYGNWVFGASAAFTDTGTPVHYMRDYDQRGIRLIPIPVVADTLELQCTVTLAAPLVAGSPLPFTEVPDERLLVLKMKALAYGKQDTDTFDPNKSKEFATEFEERAQDRAQELRNYRRAAPLMQMAW